jgi:hypothetical protein
VAQRAGPTRRVDRHCVGDAFTLEDLHGGEGRLARDDGEVSVGKGRGGIEVLEGHDLGERGRRGAKKGEKRDTLQQKESSEGENWSLDL